MSGAGDECRGNQKAVQRMMNSNKLPLPGGERAGVRGDFYRKNNTLTLTLSLKGRGNY